MHIILGKFGSLLHSIRHVAAEQAADRPTIGVGVTIVYFILHDSGYAMGQYNSRNEEIIVAQAGANQQIDELKSKMSAYSIAVIAVTVCVALIIFCLCCKRCNKSARKWIQAELRDVIVVPQPSTQVRTEQSQSTPAKVIFS